MDDRSFRASYVDDVRAAYTSEGLSGGTVALGGPIGQPGSLQPGQLTADEFARRLAAELVARCPNVPGHGEGRLQLEAFVAAMVAHGIAQSESLPPDNPLSLFFGLPSDTGATADEVIAQMVNRIPAKNLEILPQLAAVAALAPEGLDDPEGFAWPVLSAIVVGMKDFVPLDQLAYACSFALAPVPGSLSVSKEEGNDVHRQLQDEYRLGHCDREVIIERRVWRCNQPDVTLAKGRLDPYLFTLDQVFRSGRRGYQRADIIDIGGNPYVMFEIKTRRLAPVALVQMRMYAGIYNVGASYKGQFNYPAIVFGTSADWTPKAMYTLKVSPGKIAVPHQLPMLPGLILYDVFKSQPLGGGGEGADALAILLIMLALLLLLILLSTGGAGAPVLAPALVPVVGALTRPLTLLGARARPPALLAPGLRRARNVSLSPRQIVQVERLETEVYALADRLGRAWEGSPAGSRGATVA